MKLKTRIAVTVVVEIEHEKQMSLGEVERIASSVTHVGRQFGVGEYGGYSATEFERRIDSVHNPAVNTDACQRRFACCHAPVTSAIYTYLCV